MAYSMWFQKINGIGDKTLFRLKSQFSSMAAAYEGKERELLNVLNAKQFLAFRTARHAIQPFTYLEKIEAQGIRYVGYDDEIYPEKLRQIPDSPFGLFVKGSLPNEKSPAVAMIGTRACSEYGKSVAKLFAYKMADYGVQVISGMARGIDSISQQSCLEAGGHTFAVLGNGVDICYPKELGKLYDGIQKQGGLISSYPPGTPPMANQFPPRNRLISGLSDIIFVIEARRKSGTLITVDMALEQGKEVAVIPGRITDEISQGCHDLIRQGAVMITEPEQILELLSESAAWNCAVKDKNKAEKKECHRANLMKSEAVDSILFSVLEILDNEPREAEALYIKWQSNGNIGKFSDFMNQLMDLELSDLCKSYKKRFYID